MKPSACNRLADKCFLVGCELYFHCLRVDTIFSSSQTHFSSGQGTRLIDASFCRGAWRGTREKLSDLLVQEFCVGGVTGGAGCVSPKRRDRRQRSARYECCFIARVSNGEVKICF